MTELCRTCLIETCNTDYIKISSKFIKDKTLLDCIVEFSSIQVIDEDSLSQFICNRCYTQLHEFYEFRDIIITSDKILKDKLNSELKLQIKDDASVNIGKIAVKDEVTQSHISEDIRSDLENDIFDNPSNFNYFNTYENVEEDYVCNRNSNVNIPSKTKEKNTARKSKSKIQRIHECKECQKVFKKADHLNIHVAYKHSEKQFKCEICEKKFARKYDLAYHSRVHTGERPFTCEMCGKSFASSSYLHTHKRIHTGHKKMNCEFCQNSFNNSDQLQIHIRQKHTGERPFLCEICSHAFTSSSALFRHKRDVHDQKVQCPICNKLYTNRILKEHLKRHKEREEGIKRFICDLCGKRFTCATSRKRHLVIHSGEKSFRCEVCEKSFNQRSTLQTHMRIHSQVRQFHCEICSKGFRYKHHLKIHCEKHHKIENDCSSGDIQHYENTLIKSE